MGTGRKKVKIGFVGTCQNVGIFPNNTDVNSVSAFVIDLLTPGADLDWNSRGLGEGPQETFFENLCLSEATSRVCNNMVTITTAFVNTEAMRF